MKLTYDPNLYELEDGPHLAQFDGVEKFDTSKSKTPEVASYGPSISWRFTVVHGDCKGKVANVITAERPTKKNSCIRMLAGIIGHPPAEQEEINTDDFRGKYYRIIVVDGRLSHQYPPQYMGNNYQQALSTFDPNATPVAPQANDPVPF